MELFVEYPFVYQLCGSIIMFMLGIAAGNYATSLVYRIPRGLVIANDPPYCECDKRVYLKPSDLFPLFSWLHARGKCRYCDIRIPATYAVMEFLCGFLFITNFLIHGVGQELVLILSLDVMLITLAALYYMQGRLYTIIVVSVAGLGAIYRTLLDDSILGFVMGGYLGLMLGIILWGLEMAIRRKKIVFPDYAIVLAVGGLCVGREQLIPLFIVAFIIACLTAALSCISKKFLTAAWIIGITGSVILALSHVS